jgi:hypothetical protein
MIVVVIEIVDYLVDHLVDHLVFLYKSLDITRLTTSLVFILL